MEIKVKIYSCYELTYKQIYKDVISRLYPEFDTNNVILEIEDISNNSTRSIQSQRSLAKYVRIIP